MSILQRLKNARPKPVQITVPSWEDEEIYIMPFNLTERQEFDINLAEHDITSVMIATTLERIVEENGDRVFDEESDEHMEIFRSLNAEGLAEVFQAICNKDNRRSAAIKGALGNSRKRRK